MTELLMLLVLLGPLVRGDVASVPLALPVGLGREDLDRY